MSRSAGLVAGRASRMEPFIDVVNQPPHYTNDPSGVECITITRHRNFNIGNAIKYLWRAGIKDEAKTIEDWEKAVFYINDEINRLRSITGDKTEG